MNYTAGVAMLIALSCGEPAFATMTPYRIWQPATDVPMMPSPSIEQLLSKPEKFEGKTIQLCDRLTGKHPVVGAVWGDRVFPSVLVRVAPGNVTNEAGCLIGKLERDTSANAQVIISETVILQGWQFVPDKSATAEQRVCLSPETLAGTEIFAAGTHSGTIPTSYSIEGDDDAVDAIAVSAQRTGKPVILVLTGYAPILWDLRGMPKERLRAVLIYGEAGQAVLNEGKQVPIRFITRNAAAIACGIPFALDDYPRSHDQLNELLINVIGRKADHIFTNRGSGAVNLEAGFGASVSAPIHPPIQSSAPIWVDPVPPRGAGIKFLLADGSIRLADPSEIAAWLKVAKPRMKKQLWVSAGEHLREERTYTILKQITLPRGMYGGNLAHFIIPADVPDPVDHGSHNFYAYLKDGHCSGSPCD